MNRGMRLLAISLTLTLTTAAFRAPPIRCCATGPASTKELYSKIDGIIRRARSKTDDRLAASISRALGNRWLEMEPEKLVEATVVSGTVLLDSFDDGLDLLIEAEEGAALNSTATTYSALMRLALSEEKPVEASALFARARSLAVESTDGLLLSAMSAAALLGDWGAVARLYAELAESPEYAAMEAALLETMAPQDPSVLEELREAMGAGATAAKPAPPQNLELAQALALALRAHCERGDVTRVVELLERARSRGAALEADEYQRLVTLATQTKRPQVLLALQPIDLQRSLAAAIEPKLFEVQSKVGLAAAGLGRVERQIVAGVGVAAVLATIVLALSGGGDAPLSTDVFDTLDNMDTLTSGSVRGLY